MLIKQRFDDISKLIDNLDIPPTLFKNACEKYKNLAEFLTNNGIKADIYPQGSFALGTVVKPYSSEMSGYDLDFICLVEGNREDYDPLELKNEVYDVLQNSDRYKNKIVNYDKCITIKYAGVDGYDFSIDIVPATDETIVHKIILASKCNKPELISTTIAIPSIKAKNQEWISTNPKGYLKWFNEINKPFKNYSELNYRNRLFNNNKQFYQSIEKIPDEMIRSSLQRVIQIIKRHRDIYYKRIDKEDLKPLSSLITTLVTNICKNESYDKSEFDLLNTVIDTLTTYKNPLNIKSDNGCIRYQNDKWYVDDPSNPESNFADEWNENKKIPNLFFQWISALKEEFVDSINEQDDQVFRNYISRSFGSTFVQNHWDDKYLTQAPKEISISTYHKPWRKNANNQ